MHFRTRFVYFQSCRYNLCIFERHLPLLLRRCSYNLCIFARDLSLFNGCRYNLCIFKRHLPLLLRRFSYNFCIFARDLSILRVVDIIYAFSIDTYPYYYGCLLYTSPSPRDKRQSRMPSSA